MKIPIYNADGTLAGETDPLTGPMRYTRDGTGVSGNVNTPVSQGQFKDWVRDHPTEVLLIGGALLFVVMAGRR